MAFVSTQLGQTVFGNMRATVGKYTQGEGDLGGAVETGLSEVFFFNASAALEQEIVGGTATIVTPNPGKGVEGRWAAIGY